MTDLANPKSRVKKKKATAKKPAVQAESVDYSSFHVAVDKPVNPAEKIDGYLRINHSPSLWSHPLLNLNTEQGFELTVQQLDQLTDHYYCQFLPFFTNQKEGSICGSVNIELSKRMAQKLGLSYLFERIIRLNLRYFAKNPSQLPYTLFHEMVHLWLYDCNLDPNHTKRFYKKMEEFSSTGLPVDKQVHIHSRIASEAKYVYSCPNCQNRWYLKRELSYPIYCGLCFDRDGVEHYAALRKNIDGASRT